MSIVNRIPLLAKARGAAMPPAYRLDELAEAASQAAEDSRRLESTVARLEGELQAERVARTMAQERVDILTHELRRAVGYVRLVKREDVVARRGETLDTVLADIRTALGERDPMVCYPSASDLELSRRIG